MIIRKAILADAEPIATYLLLAMETIVYEFIGENNPQKARDFLLHFVKRPANQYSFENCWVVEAEHQVIAAVNIYEGGALHTLRAPIAQYIKSEFNKNFNPEDETQAGEYYIDSLGVNSNFQGRGIGGKILGFLIAHHVDQQKQTLGLLVDEDNPNAKRLYLKLGFKPVGVKTLVGKKMLHLQLKS